MLRSICSIVIFALALDGVAWAEGEPPDQITDDDLLLFMLQEAVFLEGNSVDTGRQFLKQAGGLSEETSYALIARAKQIVRETEHDIPQNSRARLCAKRASLSTGEKLGRELNAEEQRSADERRQKARSIRSMVSAKELERMLAFTDRHSSTSLLVIDQEEALRGRNAQPIIDRICEGIES